MDTSHLTEKFIEIRGYRIPESNIAAYRTQNQRTTVYLKHPIQLYTESVWELQEEGDPIIDRSTEEQM